MKSYIYTLLDENNHIFYVGRSIDPTNRLEQHIDESVKGTSKKCRYIRDMMKRGHFPTTKVVDEASVDDIDALESEWIAKLDSTLHDDGYIINLQNGNAGSAGNDYTNGEVVKLARQFKVDHRKRERLERLKAAEEKRRLRDQILKLYADDASIPQFPARYENAHEWADDDPGGFKRWFKAKEAAQERLYRKHVRKYGQTIPDDFSLGHSAL